MDVDSACTNKTRFRKKVNKDITINDYANAKLPRSASRISKQIASSRELKNWWELTDEDFIDIRADDSDSEIRRSESGPDFSPKNSTRGKKSPDECKPHQLEHQRYSIDVWLSISRHVAPEDVCRFSLICYETHFVTTTALFWKMLFTRFYDPSVTGLHERFGPRCVDKLYGLKSCVIKSLFHCYRPLCERVHSAASQGATLSSQQIDKLCRGVCSSVWHDRHENSRGKTYHFYFKFITCQHYACLKSDQSSDLLADWDLMDQIETGRSDWSKKLKIFDDITVNREEGCFILRAICTHFTHVPSVLGYRLSEFAISLNSDMRTHRVRLKFESKRATKHYKRQSGQQNAHCSTGPKEHVALDGVQSLCLMDWWHPNYPLPIL